MIFFIRLHLFNFLVQSLEPFGFNSFRNCRYDFGVGSIRHFFFLFKLIRVLKLYFGVAFGRLNNGIVFIQGISRDTWHKRRKTGGKRKPLRKKRKYELGRPAANTKVLHIITLIESQKSFEYPLHTTTTTCG